MQVVLPFFLCRLPVFMSRVTTVLTTDSFFNVYLYTPVLPSPKSLSFRIPLCFRSFTSANVRDAVTSGDSSCFPPYLLAIAQITHSLGPLQGPLILLLLFISALLPVIHALGLWAGTHNPPSRFLSANLRPVSTAEPTILRLDLGPAWRLG